MFALSVASGGNVVVFVVCLQDSVLAFWKHGLKGRSLQTNEVNLSSTTMMASLMPEEGRNNEILCCSPQVTQEITDKSRVFQVLGTTRYVLATVVKQHFW